MKLSEFAHAAETEEIRTASPAAGIGPAEAQLSRRIQWAQALVLVALFTALAIINLRNALVSDADVWWHLRTAEWMLEHHGVPRTDPFSILGAGKPWAAYSWLFELLIFQLFQRLGLVGIVAYTTGMAVAIAIAMIHLMKHLKADFTFAVLLTAVASYSISRLYTPRPWLFTILFFVLELDLLIQARKTGKLRNLLWLPVIFALWSNLHIQFIDGLAVLFIALAEALLARKWSGAETRIRPGWMCGVSASCVLATLANPFSWKIYKIAYDLAAQQGVLNKVSELSALPFRDLDDWFVLLLALVATGVLARTRRFAFFESILMVFAIYVSFRSQRDVWVVVTAAGAILAAGLKGDEANRFQLKSVAVPLVGLATVLAVLVSLCVLQLDNGRLRANLAEVMPVRAVEVVREKGWSGPLYNDYNWGGYLIWALRMPVSIDGRAALYGDEVIDRSVATWNGEPDWASDTNLLKAGLVIGPVKSPLTQLLRMDPRFQLAYEDKLAAVFVARRNLSSAAATTPSAVGGADHGAVK
jgi:hypothetical protein